MPHRSFYTKIHTFTRKTNVLQKECDNPLPHYKFPYHITILSSNTILLILPSNKVFVTSHLIYN